MMLAFAIGALPTLPWPDFGSRSPALGFGFFAINLAICVAGYRTGHFRVLWIIWGVASVLTMIAVGFSTPLGLLAILPAIAPFAR